MPGPQKPVDLPNNFFSKKVWLRNNFAQSLRPVRDSCFQKCSGARADNKAAKAEYGFQNPVPTEIFHHILKKFQKENRQKFSSSPNPFPVEQNKPPDR